MKYLRVTNTHKDLFDSCVEIEGFQYKHIERFIESNQILAPQRMSLDECIKWLESNYDIEEYKWYELSDGDTLTGKVFSDKDMTRMYKIDKI